MNLSLLFSIKSFIIWFIKTLRHITKHITYRLQNDEFTSLSNYPYCYRLIEQMILGLVIILYGFGE
jgi:hypothetical protein